MENTFYLRVCLQAFTTAILLNFLSVSASISQPVALPEKVERLLDEAIGIYEHTEATVFEDHPLGIEYGPHSLCYYFFQNDSEGLLGEVRSAARYFVSASRGLSADGYPVDVWHPALERYVTARIFAKLNNLETAASFFPGIKESLRGEGDFEEAYHSFYMGRTELDARYILLLFRLLADYEQRMYLDVSYPLSEILEGIRGCGGDSWYTFEIVTDDNVVQLELMDRFQFLLCSSQGNRPFSVDCPGRNFRFGQVADIGRYMFRLVWRDGGVACGMSDFIEFGTSAQDDQHSSIYFAPSPNDCPV